MSFHLRLTAFGAVLVLFVSVLGVGLTYSMARGWLEAGQERELLAIVNTAAPQLDGDILSLITRRPDGSIQGEEEHAELQATLDRVVARNRLTSRGSPLYVMRPAHDFARTSELEFVVMARGGDGSTSSGNTYPATAHLKEALRGRATTSGVYADAEGMWISAAAPIFDSRGAVVGIVQADRPVDWFNQQARTQTLPLFAVALAGIVLSTLLAYVFARGLVQPVQRLVTATHEIASGNLRHRVALTSNDEMSDLARSVNTMAERLEEAHAELLLQRERLSEALDAAQAASKAKGEFLANMSHELRTPLNAIIGYSEMLAEDASDEGRTSDVADLSRILVAAKHLRDLIVTVLDFSKLEADRITVALEWHPVATLVEAARGIVDPLARKGGNTLVVANELGDTQVHVDAFRLQQCLLNLLGNACKFTEGGTVRLSVSADVRNDMPGVAWAVSDTGPGISAANQQKLFVPFSQVDSSEARRHGGTGLGLALTKRLCRLMGGDITVSSVEGQGSTFTIWLPVDSAVCEASPGRLDSAA